MPLVIAVLAAIVIFICLGESSSRIFKDQKNFLENYSKTNMYRERKYVKYYFEEEKLSLHDAFMKAQECIVKEGFMPCTKEDDYCIGYKQTGEYSWEVDKNIPELKIINDTDRNSWGVNHRRERYWAYLNKNNLPIPPLPDNDFDERYPDEIIYNHWPQNRAEAERQAACATFEMCIKPEGSFFVHEKYGDCQVDKNELYVDYEHYYANGICYFHEIHTGEQHKCSIKSFDK